MHVFVSLVIEFLVIGTFLSKEVPLEGCNSGRMPPGPVFYPNSFLHTFFDAIPASAIDQMEDILNTTVSMHDRDYPPGSATGRPVAQQRSWVFEGASGRAFLHLRLYGISTLPKDLQLAKAYIDDALDHLPPWNPKEIGLLKGNVGVYGIASIVYSLLGNPNRTAEYLSEVIAEFSRVDSSTSGWDYDDGIAGLLQLRTILNDFFGYDAVPLSLAVRAANALFEIAYQYRNRTTGVLHFSNPPYMKGQGAGASGPILQLTRILASLNNETIEKHVRLTNDWYASIQLPSGQMPDDPGYPNRVQWCHGAPGLVATFLQAHQTFGEDKYLLAATKAADFTAEEGILVKGMQLGHGVSGNIYLILQLYEYTQDPQYLSKAISMLMVALKTPALTGVGGKWVSYDCVPGAFWVASPAGMATLMMDLLAHQDDLSQVHMPLFSIHYK